LAEQPAGRGVLVAVELPCIAERLLEQWLGVAVALLGQTQAPQRFEVVERRPARPRRAGASDLPPPQQSDLGGHVVAGLRAGQAEIGERGDELGVVGAVDRLLDLESALVFENRLLPALLLRVEVAHVVVHAGDVEVPRSEASRPDRQCAIVQRDRAIEFADVDQ